jgi:hypothetical protein
MNPTQMPTTGSRANRVLIALAAAWMILSLAIGGAVGAGTPTDERAAAPVTGTVQP